MRTRTLAVAVGILLYAQGATAADTPVAPDALVYDERLPVSLPVVVPPTLENRDEQRHGRRRTFCPFVIQTAFLRTLGQTPTWPPPQPYYYEEYAQELHFGDEEAAHIRAAAILAQGLKIRQQGWPVATFIPPHLVTLVQTAPGVCEANIAGQQERYLERLR